MSSPPTLDEPALAAIHRAMEVVAQRLRLPFRTRTWRGLSGNWLGAGIGSSIDFQDHRPYLPGDDPRYIDWQAFARTGHYSMKLYREEISPLVDLVLDLSESMFLDETKTRRVLELFYFCVESALQAGCSLRCHAVHGLRTMPLAIEAVLGHRWIAGVPAANFQTETKPRNAATTPPALAAIPTRHGSLRVFISDLLFPGSPHLLLTALGAAKGRGLILAPFCAAELEPDWAGNVEITDCETRQRRVQHVAADLLTRYRHAYARHFELWKEHCRKHAVTIARVATDPSFSDAVQNEALRAGAVELVK
jgi:uncharacterized protein (DUF58 family)